MHTAVSHLASLRRFIAEEAPKPAEMLNAGADQGKLVRELMQEKEKATAPGFFCSMQSE